MHKGENERISMVEPLVKKILKEESFRARRPKPQKGSPPRYGAPKLRDDLLFGFIDLTPTECRP
jgi:hypothetical protein